VETTLGQTSEVNIKMDMSQSICVDGSMLEQQDLLSYLSQVVLTMIDDETKRKHATLEEWKVKLGTLRNEVQKEKDILQRNSSELSRQKTIGRILTMINTLKREGVLSGQNGRTILKLLGNIESKDFHALRILEERLAVYLPDR
jgi:hypothetical protein